MQISTIAVSKNMRTCKTNFLISNKLGRFLIAAFLLIIGMGNADAATKTWIGASGGSWATAGNWSPAAIPTTTDDIVITPTSTTFSITSVSTVTISSLTVNASSGNKLTLVGSSTTLTISGTGASNLIAINQNLTLQGITTVNASNASASFTLAAGQTFDCGTTSFTFAGSSVTFGSSSTLKNTSGTITFSNATASYDMSNLTGSTIGGTLAFTGVTSGTITYPGSGLTINGTLQIHANKSAAGSAPTYNSGATLSYISAVATQARTISTSEIGTGQNSTPINLGISFTGTQPAVLTMDGNRTWNNITFTTNGKIAIGNATLTINGTVSGSSSSASIRGSSSSNLTINGSGSLGTIFFDNTTQGTTNQIATLTINRSAGTVTMGTNGSSPLFVTSSLVLTAGNLVLAGNVGDKLAVTGSFSRTSGQITCSSTSALWIGSGTVPANFFGTYISNAAAASIGTIRIYNSSSCTGNTTGYAPTALNIESGSTFENAGTASTGTWNIATLSDSGTVLFSNTVSGATTTAGTLNAASGSALTFSGASVNQLSVTGTFTDNGATFTNDAPAVVSFGSSATYSYGKTGGANYPIYATWNATSTFTVAGAIASMISLSSPAGVHGDLTNQTFGHFTWNAPTQSADVTLAGNLTCAGNFTMTSTNGKIFSLGGFTINCGGNFANSLSTGTIDASGSGSTINMNGATQTLNIGAAARYTNSIVDNLTVSSSVSTTLSSNALNVNNLTINGSKLFSIGTLAFSVGGSGSGTYTNSGTITVNGASSTFELKMDAGSTFNIGTYTGSSITNLKISTGSTGITWGTSVNAATLTMNTGIVTTDATHLITVTGTAAANVTGGSSTCYIKGPLARTFTTTIATGSYLFPVGKSTWNEFDMIVSASTSATSPVITVQSFDAQSNGSPGAGFDTTGTYRRYWQASLTNAISTVGTISIRLFDAAYTIGSSTAIGNSGTQTGTYNSLGGFNANVPSAGYITSAGATPLTLGFYEIGAKGCLSGTYTVGPSANFAKITDAITALNGGQVCDDVVFELQSGYDGTTGESFPITINTPTYAGAYKVAIRPASGVSSNLTTGNTTNTIFVFNGANNITLDGTPGGAKDTSTVGGSRWIIKSTSTSLPTIHFTNSGSYTAGAKVDTLKFLQVQGQNVTGAGTASYTTAGTISFSNTYSTSNGDSAIVIDHCAIGDNGAGTPVAAIYSYGLSAALGNNNNSVTNCNIYNFWTGTSVDAGINIQTNSSAWTITGNNFYQTTSRTSSSASVQKTAILINNSNTGTNFTISNNYIGGAAANHTGTWTVTSSSGHFFVGIDVDGLSTGASTVSNNTIANMSWTCTGLSAGLPGIFTGILSRSSGTLNILNNTIGATSGTGSIAITNGTSGGNVYGIGHTSSSGFVNIQNNTIGAITVSGTTTSIPTNFTGIIFAAGTTSNTRTISGNVIGSTITANSINLNTAIVGGLVQTFKGISNEASGANATNCSNNIIDNINNATTGSGAGQTIGINLTSGINTITGNKVDSMTTASTYTGTANSATIVGIVMNATSATGHTVSNNEMLNLSCTNSGAVLTHAVGLYFACSAGTANTDANIVNANLISNLSLSTTSASATIDGMYIATSISTRFSNNMIRIGFKPDGSSITPGMAISGIQETGTAGGNNYYFNSIYLGGTGVTGVNATWAFVSGATSGTRNIKDNIFFNARTPSTTTNFAIRLGATSGVACNYNDLFATNSTQLGNIAGSTNYASLSAWKTGTSQDANSISADPLFNNATGTAANLHIVTTGESPIEGTGLAINAITTDYDGQLRASYSPTDIGADAGSFSAVQISYSTSSVSGQCGNGDRTVTATIIDSVASINTTTLPPTIYFNKNGGSWSSSAGSQTSGDGTNGVWSFTISASTLGGLSSSDVVRYYIIAEDGNGNIISNPAAGLVASDVNTVTTPPTTPNSYTILPTLSGTYTVGTGGTYATLTAAVAAYNTSCISGSVVFSLTSSIYGTGGTSETFPIKINANSSASATNTLTIQPSGTSSIIGAMDSGLIVLNGANYVTINGSNSSTVNSICPFSSASQNLTINNTNTTANTALTLAVVWIGNSSTTGAGATHNTIENCIVESGSTVFGDMGTGIGIGAAYNTTGASYYSYYGGGNNYNSVVNNFITSLHPTTGTLYYGILAQGGSSVKDEGNSINLNLIGAGSATLQTSYIYRAGIEAEWEDSITISGNAINGIYAADGEPVCGIGLGLLVNGNSGEISFYAANSTGCGSEFFAAQGDEVTNATITDNIIGDVGLAGGSGGGSSAGIALSANTTSTSVNLIANNSIWGVYGYAPASFSGTCTFFPVDAGIFVGGGVGTTNVYYNSVSMGPNFVYNTGSTLSTIYGLAVSGVVTSNPIVNVKNNIFSVEVNGLNKYNEIPIGLGYSGSYTNLNSDNNDLFAKGKSGNGIFVGSVGSLVTNSATTEATLSNWQSVTGQDAHSVSDSVSFTAITDLTPVSTGTLGSYNQSFFAGTATPISGITQDINCATRSTTAPDMGAFEFILGTDAAATAVILPTPFCAGVDTVKATIQNAGSSTLTSATVYWSVNGVSQGSVSPSISLASGASTTIVLGTYTFSSGTQYTIIDSVSAPNGGTDSNLGNDAASTVAYAGFPATVYVGSGSGTPSYATFSDLFDAINASGLTNDINVYVQASTTEPASPSALNAANACSGGTYHIYIQPSSATLYTISGATGGSSPAVITLNGASNVTIDGRYSGSGQWLKFINATSSATANTITLQNNAAYDTIRYCLVDLQSSANNTGACIALSSSSSSGSGNSYNAISNNSLGDAGTFLSTNIVYSTGSSGALNHDNTISNNNIFNFGDPTQGNGISINGTGNGSNWVITGNSFYETGTVGSGVQVGINFLTGAASTNNIIKGNYIGGTSSALSGGTISGTWTSTASSYVYGLSINTGTDASNPTIVKQNTISNISALGLEGVNIAGGSINIDSNLIGSTTSVKVLKATAGGAHVYGISTTSTNTVNITNNTIEGLYENSTTGAVACIVQSAGLITITGNIVGNSLSSSGTSGAQYYSAGMVITVTASGSNLISKNVLGFIGNDQATLNGANSANGLVLGSSSGLTCEVSANKLSDFFHSGGQGGTTFGIQIQGTGNWNVFNNFLNLYNEDYFGTVYGTRKFWYGIADYSTGGTNNYYYNSVLMQGTSNSGGATAYNSYCFLKNPGGTQTGTGSVTTVKNNILVNSLVWSGAVSGSTKYYAIGNIASSPATNWTSDYNFIADQNTSNYPLGKWGSTDETTLTAWRTASSNDANSPIGSGSGITTLTTGSGTVNNSTSSAINPYDLFVDPANGNLHGNLTTTASYAPYNFIANNANPASGITSVDFDGDVRSGSTPTIGADEFSVCSTPATPTVTNTDGCGNTVLSTTATGGTLSWSTGATTSSITVSDNATYSVTITVTGGCTATGSGSGSPLTPPSAPSVTVTDNCDNTSTLSTTATGTLLWSTGATTSSITVTASGTYSVTQTDGSGCTSSSGTGSASPKSTPSAPSVSATNNCNGTSTLSTGAAGSLSWSTGATTSSITVSTAGTYSVHTTVNGCTSADGSGSASLGSCGGTFTVKLFLQGYYLNGGTMSPLLKLLNASANATDVDSVTIELHDSGSPTTVDYSYSGILQTNGNTVLNVDAGAIGNSYYVVVKHRNSLTTYSAATVPITNGGSYDFTSGAGQAYGTGSMANMGGVYAIYSGDVNQDGSINASDKTSIQSALSSFVIGSYDVKDVTGDGFVDEDDLRIIQNNAPLSLSVQHP